MYPRVWRYTCIHMYTIADIGTTSSALILCLPHCIAAMDLKWNLPTKVAEGSPNWLKANLFYWSYFWLSDGHITQNAGILFGVWGREALILTLSVTRAVSSSSFWHRSDNHEESLLKHEADITEGKVKRRKPSGCLMTWMSGWIKPESWLLDLSFTQGYKFIHCSSWYELNFLLLANKTLKLTLN